MHAGKRETFTAAIVARPRGERLHSDRRARPQRLYARRLNSRR